MKILYINIDSDTESRDITEQQLANAGFQAERLPATVEDNRVLAFNKSVYRAMHEAYVTAVGPQTLLLFEDDVMFEPWFKWPYSKIAVLPDFLTIHLGCNIIGADTTKWQMPTAHSAHLAKLHNCWQSHATLYSAECVKYILDNFKYVTDEYKTEGCMIFDEWLRLNVLPMGRSYVMRPMVAWQRPRKSEIWNCQSDYTGAHIQGNNYLKTL